MGAVVAKSGRGLRVLFASVGALFACGVIAAAIGLPLERWQNSKQGAVAALAEASAAADQRATLAANRQQEKSSELRISERLCAQADNAKPPPTDLPTAAERKALADCDSADAYYGIEHPRDVVWARKCAFTEIEDEDSDGPWGAGVLAMIYANGEGVTQNLDVATRMACHSSQAPYDIHHHVLLIDARRRDGLHSTRLDYCEGLSGYIAIGQCVRLDGRRADVARSKEIARLGRTWSPARWAGWKRVRGSAERYGQARVGVEFDMTTTMRQIFLLEEQASIRDFDAKLLRDIATGKAHSAPGDYRRADIRLNVAYRKVMQGNYMDRPNDPGIRDAQRAWLRHRDSWISFVKREWPSRVDAAAARLTDERTRMLTCLLADAPDDLDCSHGR
jgi:uncharacterized protein YecT (DUF1311 family)